MTQTRRFHSIARRIGRSFVMRMGMALLIMNLLVYASVLAYAGYTAEKNALKGAWQADLTRKVIMKPAPTFSQRLETAEYTFALKGEEAYLVPAGALLVLLYGGAYALLGAEALLLLILQRGAKRRIRYLLVPLRKIAETAQELSQSGFDEQRVHTLEDAIDQLSVQTPEARLQIGDSELSGLEASVNNLIKRMHEAYRQQIRFVSDASHELRTPIAVIRGYADLLSRWGKDDQKVKDEAVQAILSEADNMQRLVEQLLFLARGDAGRTPFAPRAVNLHELIQETHEEYTLIDISHQWRLKSEGPVRALGDEAMLKQLLRILSDNALRFSSPGTAITLRAFYNEKGLACFSVQDNGVGISSEDLPHVFERFFRTDPARGRGGTGLGLAIAKWIVDRHSGYIDVYSRVGMGTRFTVSLPAAPDKAGKLLPAPTAEPE